MDYSFLKVSNGSGDAALMHVETERLEGATTIEVDVTTNVPDEFIATQGFLLPNNLLDPATVTNFYGHLAGGNIEIDGFLPGSTDTGTDEGMVVIIKPNTFWANLVAKFIMDATNSGTPGNVTFADVSANDITADSITTDGNASIGGNTSIDGNISIQGTSSLVGTSTTSADGDNKIIAASQAHSVNALAVAAQIAEPSYGTSDRMTGELRIKDNGTARALTWTSDWVAIGVTLPTATVANKYMYISYEYCAADDKFHVLGIARQA